MRQNGERERKQKPVCTDYLTLLVKRPSNWLELPPPQAIPILPDPLKTPEPELDPELEEEVAAAAEVETEVVACI